MLVLGQGWLAGNEAQVREEVCASVDKVTTLEKERKCQLITRHAVTNIAIVNRSSVQHFPNPFFLTKGQQMVEKQ
jgi:hypothetical protein